MPDGSPQLTKTWVTTDGENVVINIVGGRQSIDDISQKYLGMPYPNFSGNPNEARVLVTIEADKVTPPARG